MTDECLLRAGHTNLHDVLTVIPTHCQLDTKASSLGSVTSLCVEIRKYRYYYMYATAQLCWLNLHVALANITPPVNDTSTPPSNRQIHQCREYGRRNRRTGGMCPQSFFLGILHLGRSCSVIDPFSSLTQLNGVDNTGPAQWQIFLLPSSIAVNNPLCILFSPTSLTTSFKNEYVLRTLLLSKSDATRSV